MKIFRFSETGWMKFGLFEISGLIKSMFHY